MNTHRPRLALALTCAVILGKASIASAQWTNFTDYAPGAGTAANALSLTSIPVSPGVPVALKDINTGANLTPTLTAFYSGNVTFEGTQGNPAPGTPLYNLFTGYVDFTGTPNPSIALNGAGAVVTYTFSGLDPGKRYSFQGSAVRANGYVDRWTTFELAGADSFTSHHTPNVLTAAMVPGVILTNQAVVNTGINDTAGTGDMVDWRDIDPGSDGIISVNSYQYTGAIPPTPQYPSGGTSGGAKGYGMTGFRLEEIQTGERPVSITIQPQSQTVAELQPASFSVGAAGNSPITFQWYRGAMLLSGATNATYAIASAQASDNNAQFQVIVANTASNVNYSVTSSVAVLTVNADTTPPTLLQAATVYPNKVTVLFSEPILLSTATNLANYAITNASGTPLSITGATLSPNQLTVTLTTATPATSTFYTVVVNGIRDISGAGNQIAANSFFTFMSYAAGPRVLSITPTPGSTVSNLSQISVLFSQPVVGVDDFDIQVNATDAAGVSSVGFTNFTFVFTQPQPGFVSVFWDPAQTMTDQAGNPFVPGDSWFYTLLDNVPPTVVTLRPSAGATVGRLTQAEVTFSEPVLGVNATNLLINGQPAASVFGTVAGPYVFQFTQPPQGSVSFSMPASSGLTDLLSNAFAGFSWTVTLDANALAPSVRINEFLASNVSTNGVKDEDGDLSPWIELFNYGNSSVNLAGYGLTTSSGDPNQWILPATNLAPGKFLLIFASGKDRTALGTNFLHTNFKLNPDGDYLGLFNAESPAVAQTEFKPQYPSQRNDYSYGLNPSNLLRYFVTPTPRATNGDSAISGVLSPVHFSVERGFFNAPFNLVLTAETPGASIRYTTDGTLPTESNGLLYTNALLMAHQTTLRAAAFMTNTLPSLVQSHTFIFLDDVIHQAAIQPGIYTNLWGTNVGVNIPDYEMDPKVVTNQAYAGTIKNDLMSIPSLSIVLNPDDMFGPTNGIYTHSSSANVGPAWTKPCSIELINPDGTTGFQLDCAIKIHGGGSREQSKEKKHPLALGFKTTYGPSKLVYPLFPDSPVTEFNALILRSEYNNHWTHEQDNLQRARATMVRDEWFKDTLGAMGSFSSHARYVHLYINGLYWGVYDPCEHHDAAFAASYLGGDKSEYDAFTAGDAGPQPVDGNTVARNAFLSIAAGNMADPAQYELVRQNLDINQYCDYMCLLLYGANLDWGIGKNWTVLRHRVPGARWLYMAWDSERTFEDVNAPLTSFVNISPDNLHSNLVFNPEYRLAFGDRVHKHFFNNGAMTTNAIIASWKARAAQVDRAMVGESARWGDFNTKAAISPVPYVGYTNTTYYTHDNDCVPYEGVLLTNYFPFRSGNVLSQFRTLGLYPSNAAPSFSQFGGRVAAGYQLSMTNNSTNASTIYFTTNGSDPRIYGSGAVSSQAAIYSNGVPVILNISSEVKARSLDANGVWSALVDANFTVGGLGLPLRITELMYNPLGSNDTFEFLELQNIGATPINLGNFSFVGITFNFSPGTILNGGERLVLASNNHTNQWKTQYPGVNVAGWFAGKLSNTGEEVALLDAAGNTITAVNYSNAGGWPTGADATGHSLEVIDPNGDPNDPANWRVSNGLNGTPGAANSQSAPPAIVLNELMAENVTAVTNGGAYPDWLELYNSGGSDVDLGNWSLSNSGNARKFVIPGGTIISAGGYLVIWCDTNNAAPGLHTGFNLGRTGENVFLYDPATNRVDAISFGLQLPDYSLGRVGGVWQLTTPTPNAQNVAAVVGSSTNLSINEWLANAPAGGADWLELFNRSSNAPVALRNIYLRTSNDVFQIKSLAFLPPGGFIQLLADQLPGPAHLDFKLHAAGDAIILSDETGAELSRVTFVGQLENISQGRLPDGSATIVSFPGTASPGASNYLPSATGPVLNEVLAKNVTAVTNSAGRVADYVELYNPNSTNIPLTGMSLSVDQIVPGQWVFPAGAIINAQSYLVVWCDGGLPASTNLEANLNTGNAIDSQSSGVYLFSSTGQLMDSVEFGFQIQDLSLGKSGGAWKLLSSPTPGATNAPPATLGSATNLHINEWMAAPLSGDDWFELYNQGILPVSLSGLYLSDNASIEAQTNSVVAPLSFIAANGFVQWVADGSTSNGRNHVHFQLDSLGEMIRLYNTNLSLIDSVEFGVQIDGVSQGRFPDGTANIVSFFTTSSPGESNYLPLPNVVINEVLTHPAAPLEDAIELSNTTGSPVPIGGWFLSNSKTNLKKYRVPDGTTLPVGGFLVFYENQFNSNNPATPFTLDSAHGDQVWFSAADGAGVLTGYRASASFGAAETNVSFGRFDTSVGTEFPAMSALTFGASNPATVEDFRAGAGQTNTYPKVGPIVINEIMYHPPDIGGVTDDTLDEYIELYNLSGSDVPMYDPAYPTNKWRLQDGIDFSFTNLTVIPAGSYVLVVSFDPIANPAQLTAFRTRYGVASTVPVYGPYIGKLANDAEAVELVKPDAPRTTPPADAGFVPYIRVDRVAYTDHTPWPSAADGNASGVGLSLQRRVAGNYGNEPLNWVAASPTAGSANSGAFLTLPIITQQPASTGGLPGTTVSFTVAASGSGPLTYQWRLNGANVSGLTNATALLANAQLPNEGNYTVFVSNPAGSVLSSAATLFVSPPPNITQQPQTQVSSLGGAASFSVLATGARLSYQWRLYGTNLPGATNSTLTLTNVQNANVGPYSVLILNAFSPALSDNAYLVINGPAITLDPQGQTNYLAATTTFTVGVSGDAPLVYQWRKNGTNIASATNVSLVLTNLQLTDSGNFSAVVSNPIASATSAVAVLKVILPLVISQQPTNAIVNPGTNVNFSVTASGQGPLIYQWQFNGSSVTGNVSATTSNLTLTNVQLTNNGNYSVIIHDDYSTTNSTNASLIVKARPIITQQPIGVTVAAGGTANISVTASGTLPMGFRWRKGILTMPNANFTNVLINTSVLTLTNVQASDATNYNVAVTNIAGAPLAGVSSNAYLTVVTPPTNQTVGAGSNVTFNVSASTFMPIVISYRWQFNGADIAGGTNTSLNLLNVQSTNAGTYGVVVSVTNATGTTPVLPVPPATFTASLSLLGPPQPVVLSHPEILPGGNFRMLLQGNPNSSYSIESSSNLTNWSALATLAYTNGLMPFTDTNAPGNTSRFYRARSP